MENLINEIIEEKKFKELLRDYLAQKISREYHYNDSEGTIIREEIRNLIKQEAKEMIQEVTQEYYEMSPIKEQIELILKNLTRQEILDLIIKK